MGAAGARDRQAGTCADPLSCYAYRMSQDKKAAFAAAMRPAMHVQVEVEYMSASEAREGAANFQAAGVQASLTNRTVYVRLRDIKGLL